MNQRIAADRILLRPRRAQEEVGGIIIPENAQEAPSLGIALLVGDAVKEHVLVYPGDVVHYNRYAGSPIELVLEDTEPVRTCIACNLPEHDAIGEARACAQARDPNTREPTFVHVWGEAKVKKEPLIVIHEKDVVLVDPLDPLEGT